MNKLSKRFLESAKSDLESSKLLYQNKKFSQAVFLFQQSVEKLEKARALELQQLKTEKLKEIGHFPIKIHEENLDKTIKGYESFERLKENFPNFADIEKEMEISQNMSSAKDLKELIDKLKNNIDPKKEEIVEFLDEIENANEKSQEKIEIEEMSEEEYKKEYTNYIKLWEPNEEIKKNIKLVFEKMPKEVMENFVMFMAEFSQKMLVPHVIGFVLSLLTAPHANRRYPSDDCSFIPDIFYNKSLPFVQLMPKMFSYQEEGIKLTKNLFVWLDKTELKI